MSEEIRPLIRWLRPAHWVALDRVAAVIICVFVYSAESEAAPGQPRWMLVALALATSLPLAARRRWPVPVLGIVLVGSLGLAALGTSQLYNLVFAIYTVALLQSTWLALAALLATFAAVSFGLLVVASAFSTGVAGPHLEPVFLSVAVVWAIGFGLRQQRAHAVTLAGQAGRRAHEQLAAERLQIARELHDIVAHAVGLIVVQAGVAHHVIKDRPEEAAPALASIQTTGRAALTEMRLLLGVLRDEDGAHVAAELAPTPGLADLEQLAALTARAGVRVDLEVRGCPRELSVGVDLAAYRIVQEALTNVIKHAGTGESRVVVSYETQALRVEVTDAGRGGPPGPTGHGLIGMRERVALYGGELDAGPRRHGGFRVAARLPVQPTPP